MAGLVGAERAGRCLVDLELQRRVVHRQPVVDPQLGIVGGLVATACQAPTDQGGELGVAFAVGQFALHGLLRGDQLEGAATRQARSGVLQDADLRDRGGAGGQGQAQQQDGEQTHLRTAPIVDEPHARRRPGTRSTDQMGGMIRSRRGYSPSSVRSPFGGTW
ncbi:hypothetical protein D3C81_1675710 [compost metagenome]